MYITLGTVLYICGHNIDDLRSSRCWRPISSFVLYSYFCYLKEATCLMSSVLFLQLQCRKRYRNHCFNSLSLWQKMRKTPPPHSALRILAHSMSALVFAGLKCRNLGIMYTLLHAVRDTGHPTECKTGLYGLLLNAALNATTLKLDWYT